MNENEWCDSLYGELQSETGCRFYVAKSHRALECGIGSLPTDAQILELGGNRGEHCRFVEHPYSRYIVTDHREVEFEPLNDRIRFEVADAHSLPFDDSAFDRVLVTCVLHHLDDPERALREMRRVVRPGGLISLTLPCDPGLAYRIGKSLGPYRSLRKRGTLNGTDPRYFHYLQHRNHYPGLVALVERVFATDSISKRHWPLRIPTWNLNLFTIFQVRLATR